MKCSEYLRLMMEWMIVVDAVLMVAALVMFYQAWKPKKSVVQVKKNLEKKIRTFGFEGNLKETSRAAECCARNKLAYAFILAILSIMLWFILKW